MHIPGFQRALDAFKSSSEHVPAYKKFLKEHGIRPNTIRTPQDFEKIPYVDKKNYLRKYPFRDLFPHGKIPEMVSASSGSSGKPFYWPRGERLHSEGAYIHSRILFDLFGLKRKRTLVIDCFSMGMWIAGTYTLSSIISMSKIEKTEVTIATPGIEVADTLLILEDLAKNFEAIVLIGYPPFLMDLVLSARERKIDFARWSTHFLFAGEQFSETWREFLYRAAGMKDELNRSASIYGAADGGIIGHETKATIAFRKNYLHTHNYFSEKISTIGEAPTFVQYYPDFKYAETVKNELVFTTDQVGIPLIRYNIHDQCTLLSHAEFRSILKESDTIKNYSLTDKDIWEMPAIVLYGRKDIAVMFYALIIYPQNIKSALEEKMLEHEITGKFIAEVVLNKNKKQKFCIHIELAKDRNANKRFEKRLQNRIVDVLKNVNAEYRKLVSSIGKQAYPKIILHQFGAESFKIKKAKHRWVRPS